MDKVVFRPIDKISWNFIRETGGREKKNFESLEYYIITTLKIRVKI